MSYRTALYYDHRGNLTCVLDPENGLTYYTYDAYRRMTSVENPWGEVTYYEYSPGGQPTQSVLGNGCVTYYSYDATGQTTKVDNRKSDLSVISSFEYERDALGNPLSIVREDGYTSYYEYDAKSQLTSELQRQGDGTDVYAWTWDYDAAGNRTVEVFNGVATYYEYNAGNELTEETTGAETTYYSYDACGNTTVQEAPGGTTYYHWTPENLLAQIDLPGDVHNYFGYDADSKRVTKQDNEGFTRFIYQGPDMLGLLQEQDGNESLLAHYTMGQGLEAMRRGTASSFYHFDWLGSTFELTDADGGVTDSYLYNAWGEIIDSSGEATNPHTYGGRHRYFSQPEIQLYLLGLRYLDSLIGMFLSRDQAQGLGGSYALGQGSPTASVDPTGLWPSLIGSPKAKCKVYYWMGDVKIWAGIDPAVEATLWEAAYESAARLVLIKRGYQVELLFSGTASDLQRANTDSRTVGIATAAHGGCSSDGDVWEFSRGGKEFSAYTTTPANNNWKPVQHPTEFVSVIAGHCYTGDNGKAGKIDLCKRAQASAMGISPGKVVTPLLVLHGGASLVTQYGAWLSFWMHFPFCCPLGRRRQ